MVKHPSCRGNVKHICVCTLLCSGETFCHGNVKHIPVCYVLVKHPCHGNVKHICVCILLCSGETAFLSWECEAHLCVYFVMLW